MTDPLEELLRKHMQQEVRSNLERLFRAGTKVTVEGHHFPISEMARVISLSEGVCYMPDYLTDEAGKLVEVRFDRVRLP